MFHNKEELQFNNLGNYKEKLKANHEMKYPFIEYLSYRLKKYGKKAYPFLMALEEQVNKMGMTVSEVVEKEHFDIALRKIIIGNCITSIKTLDRISMTEIFEEINGVEDILKQDPARVYDRMDYETKAAYRNQIKEISKRTKISELYISRKCLELSLKEYKKIEEQNDNISIIEKTSKQQLKKCHIGYYLLAEGKQKLLEELTGKKQKEFSTAAKITNAIVVLSILTLLSSGLLALYLYYQTHRIFWSILLCVLLLIPIEVIWVQLGQYILGKLVKPKIIPKLDYLDGVPEDSSTFVVIPTILNSKQKVKQLMERLEVYYMANKSENLYFALLGDVTAGKNEKEPFDDEIIKAGLEEVKRLNELYPDDNFPKFHFLYRKRTWNDKEECYLGWERKRGLLNQFNEYILGNEKDNFLANTIEQERERIKEKQENNNCGSNNSQTQEQNELPKIKYVITLDADTRTLLKYGVRINWSNGTYIKYTNIK